MKKQKRTKNETKKSAERNKQNKTSIWMSTRDQWKKKENKKAAKLQRENKTDFVKRDYYHILKWSKPKTKQGLFYFNKYQPWNNVAQCHANLEKDLCYYSSY